jgi:hypothetical protein
MAGSKSTHSKAHGADRLFAAQPVRGRAAIGKNTGNGSATVDETLDEEK